jgi:hypothetical protein
MTMRAKSIVQAPRGVRGASGSDPPVLAPAQP